MSEMPWPSPYTGSGKGFTHPRGFPTIHLPKSARLRFERNHKRAQSLSRSGDVRERNPSGDFRSVNRLLKSSLRNATDGINRLFCRSSRHRSRSTPIGMFNRRTPN